MFRGSARIFFCFLLLVGKARNCRVPCLLQVRGATNQPTSGTFQEQVTLAVLPRKADSRAKNSILLQFAVCASSGVLCEQRRSSAVLFSVEEMSVFHWEHCPRHDEKLRCSFWVRSESS